MWTSAQIDEIANPVHTCQVSLINFCLDELLFELISVKQIQSLLLCYDEPIKFLIRFDHLFHQALELSILFTGHNLAGLREEVVVKPF